MSLLGNLGTVVGGVLGIVIPLTQQQTNGNSLLGTLLAPRYPHFLTNNPLPFGYPWGKLTARDDNPYISAPYTGVTRYYDFTISRGLIAPDGYQKEVILVNGAFPGPTIEANWGDTIEVTVHNQITHPEEGTALHWHGLRQARTPWFDGVPAVHQCPIAPGSSFTYSFQADLYGSSWYHSHYSAQYAGGLLGAMIVYGPGNADYDIDLGPVFLTDYYHDEYFDIVSSLVSPGGNPAPLGDNNLINGKMTFNCSTVKPGDTRKCSNNAGISKFMLTSGKTHRLRLINAGAEAMQRFSIDGHTLTVIANDFVPIEPYDTKVVTLGIGQRTDVLVTADRGPPTSAFWMRSDISTICSLSKQPHARAAVYYERADVFKLPKSTAWNIPDPGTCTNDDASLTVPYYSMQAAIPTTTKVMEVNWGLNATGSFLWSLDKVNFRANFNNPILMLAERGNFTYPPEWNVKNFHLNTTIRIVVNNLTPVAHPMHLHGFNMQIISEGDGVWDGVSTLRFSNPQRRDVQMLRPDGYMVMQFNADNPGVWPFHCHIAWHVSAGLYSNLLVQPELLVARALLSPGIMQQTCDAWKAWTHKNTVEQVDSGL